MGFHRPLLLNNQIAAKGLVVATLASSLILGSPAAFTDGTGSGRSTWGLGLGVASSQEPYIDVDRDTNVLPLLHFESEHFRFFATTLEAKLPDLKLGETNRISFSLFGRWDGSGYEADDSWMLEGMEERESGIWAGAKMEWRTSLGSFSSDWTHDVSGNSDGQRFDLGWDRSWRFGEHVILTPRIGATWHDSEYVDYYYGVRANEARTGRSAYQGEAGISAVIGLRGVYRFNPHHSMILDFRANSLSSEVKDSPLVDQSTDNRVFIGYMYHF